MPEVRALPSTGVTRLRRYYDPVRLPPWPPPKSALRPLPPPRRVSPVTCSTFPTCHAQYPGGPQRGHLPVTSPLRAAFPDPVAGRHPRLHFRGLLRLHIALRPAGLLSRPWRPPAFARASFVTRLRSGQLPDRTACQLPELPTSLRMESSSTGATRLRDAHWIARSRTPAAL
jgi:hypothetical protein